MNEDHFDYETAERMLDAWCLDEERGHGFRRTYRLAKLVLTSIAICNYLPPGSKKITPLAMSYAWEELQVAATGYGESIVTGPLHQLYGYAVIRGEETKLKVLFETAFEMAEANTSPKVKRLYLKAKARRKMPFLALTSTDLSELQPELPSRASPLVDFALDQEIPSEVLLAYYADALDAENEQEEKPAVARQRGEGFKASHLALVHDTETPGAGT